MRVRNRNVIRRLSWKAFCANKTRNIIAALAIALTAMMFSALFTIAVTMNYSYEQQTMRQVGGYSYGGFKRLTEEQVEELRDDELIKESGATFLVGSPKEEPFHKIWAEVRFAEDNYAKFCWSLPTKGRMPSSEKEIAMDTTVLEALKLPKKLGTKVELTFPLGDKTVTDTFTLSGFWEADDALPAHMIWVDKEYAVSRMKEVPKEEQEKNGVGNWYLDMIFESTRNIDGTLKQIAENHGYTIGDSTEGDQLATGVNWAYTSTHTEAGDIQSVIVLIAAAALMLLTGYLIIYNVFQISVAGDIRFYGLLKTIGTTGRQLRRIVRYQAWILSGIGIPIGLLLGYGAGNLILPQLIKVGSDAVIYHTVSPLIFVSAALFSLVTVFISCFLPARHAAKVSPVEAVRYTEQRETRKKKKRSRSGNRIFRMAAANLLRNKLKTILVVLSLALSITMLNGVYGFTRGFSMDGFLSKFVVSDFLVADANYFNYSDWGNVSQTLAESLKSQEGYEDGGYVKAYTGVLQTGLTKEKWMHWMKDYQRFTEEEIDEEVAGFPDDAPMEIYTDILILDDYTIQHLEVIEGSLEKWKEPGSMIQLITYDDYGNPDMEGALFEVGEAVPIMYSNDYEVSDDGREITYYSKEEKEYTVIAVAAIPGVMTNRGYGWPKAAMPESGIPETMRQNLTDMIYMADFTENGAVKAEKFIADYTENIEPEMSYESRGKYSANYQQFQSTFWIVGGALSFIIGLVGILNFINGEVTAIISRRRELAMLQSIGMTGKQMKQMLILEGGLTVGMALILAVLLNVGVYFGIMPVIENLFWYFKQNFTMAMIFAAFPVLLLLGTGIPALVYRQAAKKSIVERLRESDM